MRGKSGEWNRNLVVVYVYVCMCVQGAANGDHKGIGLRTFGYARKQCRGHPEAL